MKKCVSIGGQALIEGIMMKGPQKTVMAVRGKEKEIIVEEINETSLTKKHKALNLPIIRGVINFIEAMVFGYKALMRSAELSGFADLEEENSKMSEKKQSTLMNLLMVVASVLGVGLALVLFMFLPAFLFNLLNGAVSGAITPFRALFEGLLKIIIFLVYIVLVSRTPDIKRVFMYHGAEHKTIFCYEKGLELTVENIKPQGRFHPRCGTSFMVVMLIVGILITFLVQTLFPFVTKIIWLWVAIKILILPIICGVGYEVIKFCGRHDGVVVKILSAPGLWMQRITTIEPTDDMIEIAIAAVKPVLPEGNEEC